MSAQNEDFLFAQEAQDRGYVTESQLEEAFLLQRRMADELMIDERIAVILVKRGWLAEEQARRVYALIEPEGHRTQIEGYRIVERLGRGAMGTVYKAIHLGLHRVVAIKVLRQELLGEKVHSERLGAEAKMLAALDHPNIVAALDAGESNGFPYVVMEYVEGETLKERIAREGPLEEGEALRITRAIADALERARRMGVVHRDVKPGNILISKKGEPKLMDLGLARGPIDLELTQAGATVGTPQFMSPEQVEDAGKVDTRSDIYSLGSTLYAMLTGKPPFTAKTMTEVLTKVLNEEPVPVRVRNSAVSPEVGYLVQRMMLKDASLRYQTPALVVEDIDNIAGGQSIVPSGFTGNWEAYLLRQRIRRLTRVGAFVGVFALVVTVGLVVLNSHLERKEAREYGVERRAALDETDPDPRDTVADAERKLREARDIEKDIQAAYANTGVTDAMPADVKAQIRALETYVGRYQALEQLRARALELADGRRYRTAFDMVQRAAPDHRMRAVHTRWAELLKDINQRSNEDWHAEKRAAKAGSPSDLDAVVALFEGYRQALAGDYVVEGVQAAIAVERIEVDARATEAAAIHARVAHFDAQFAPDAVDALVRQDQIASLRSAAEREADALRTVVGSQWGGAGWSEGLVRKPVGAHVEDRIEAVLERIDDAVEGRWRDVKARSDEFVDEGRMAEAKAFVESFRTGLGTTYRSLDAEASSHLERLRVQLTARQQEAARIEHDGVVAALSSLREGHVARARSRIGAAIESALTVEHGQRLRQLPYVVMAYERATDLALAYLAAQVGRLKTDVVLVDGRRELEWRPVEVNRETGEVIAKADGHRRTTRSYPIEGFAVAQLARWAQSGEGELPERDLLLLRLLELPGEPFDAVPDLLSRRAEFQQLDNDFARQSGVSLWHDYVTRAEQTVYEIQGAREARASALHNRALRYFLDGRYTMARRVYEELLGEGGGSKPWTYTRNAETTRQDDREKLETAKKEEKQREVERWIPGARAKELESAGPSGVRPTRIHIDFDVPEVLDQFVHGFGRLVEQRGQRQVTPDPAASDERYQLELLPGVVGLLPSRPLSLRSPFDPGAPIEVSFDLRTQKGAFFVAVDVDGVKLGVLSADPYWNRAWRVPEALRLDDKDDLIQFYGRGRGIAVQSGPSFFDPSGAKWSWSTRQRGPRYRDWDGKGEMDGELFAFVPGRAYRVRVRRNVDTLVLEVADLDRYERLGPEDREKVFREVFRHQDDAWARVGSAEGWRSELDPSMRQGTGRIQILSWSTVTIDDLEVAGVIRQAWRDEQRRGEDQE